jgi:VanZ family protein
VDRFLAPRHVDLVDASGNGQRCLPGDGGFPRVDLLGDADLLTRKKLLRLRMRPTVWLPPVVWMALILSFPTDVGSAEHTEGWLVPILRVLAPWATPAQIEIFHGVIRKGGHVTEYAILAALWLRALVRWRTVRPGAAVWIAFAISVAWAIVDETYQSFFPSRTASPADVAIDGTGALLAVVVGHLGWRRASERAAVLLLWIAALGGGLVLAANALTGVPSRALWLTTPAAAFCLVGRRVWWSRRHGRGDGAPPASR